MPERNDVGAIVQSIVSAARVPRPSEREALGRELTAHFEDAAEAAGSLDDAIARFGREAEIASGLRRVYRREYVTLYLAKVILSALASLAAALSIEVAVNLRLPFQADALRLAPGFWHGVTLAAAIVIAMVAAWEACRRPFSRSRAVAACVAYTIVFLIVHFLLASAGVFVTATLLVVIGACCSRLDARPARLLPVFPAFAAVEYLIHLGLGVSFPASRALLVGVVLVSVWGSTVAILTRVDHAFGTFLNPSAAS